MISPKEFEKIISLDIIPLSDNIKFHPPQNKLEAVSLNLDLWKKTFNRLSKNIRFNELLNKEKYDDKNFLIY